MTVKIHTIATVPDGLEQAWLQHLRDFDTAHPECHFAVVLEGETKTIADVMKAVKVDPPFAHQLFIRKPEDGKPAADHDWAEQIWPDPNDRK